MADKPTVLDLKVAIYTMEHERLQAQMSGFETGFEHPNTQTAYNDKGNRLRGSLRNPS